MGRAVWFLGAFAAVMIVAFADLGLSPGVAAQEAGVIEEGKVLAVDRRKGNCLACHFMAGGDTPGNIAPALVAMKARYPNKSDLRDRIWDITQFIPEAPMPPFGKHNILSDEEIDKIVEYLYTL